jgi:hypothetical protein
MECKICKNQSSFFSKNQIINKYEINYYLCKNCGFLQTEKPYWLEEAYSQAITSTDIGTASRNYNLAILSKVVIKIFFKVDKQFVDYGGGYGLFVRLMRDFGFDYYRQDKYCDNIFAKNFEADVTKKYELLTAFEVFEHLLNPIDEIEKMIKLSNNILFTTCILPKTNPQPIDWWYYGLDHGQHISIYSINSLKLIAERYKLNFYSNGTTIHLFTSKKLSRILFKIITNRRIIFLLNHLISRKSLLETDFNKIKNNFK